MYEKSQQSGILDAVAIGALAGAIITAPLFVVAVVLYLITWGLWGVVYSVRGIAGLARWISGRRRTR
jgi:hypothetical protein